MLGQNYRNIIYLLMDTKNDILINIALRTGCGA